MDNVYSGYNENPDDDEVFISHDYINNVNNIPEMFDVSSVDDFIANLDDWD
mgnify:CR=1 FL=1